MARRLRFEEPGATYHLTANAVDGANLFRDDVDRLRLYDFLLDEAASSDWTVLSYTFMSTHYHLLLTLKKCTLSSGFHRMQGRYAQWVNRRRRRRGALWQSRYHDEPVTSDSHLFEAIRYIALNAPRARITETPEAWPWCSYGSAIGLYPRDAVVDERALLGLFAHDAKTARRRLRAYVEEKDPRERWRQTRVKRGSDPGDEAAAHAGGRLASRALAR